MAWSTASWMLAELAPSGTLDGLQAEVSDGIPGTPLRPRELLSPLITHKPPKTATRAMSTTSSFGRRPFGKPAKSLACDRLAVPPTRSTSPATPRRFWSANCTGAMAVFRRSTSEGVAVAGLLTPAIPVRNTVAKSVRGRLVGATPLGSPVSTRPKSTGRVGLVT